MGMDKTKKLIYLVLFLTIATVGLAVFFAVRPTIKKVYVVKDEFEERKLQFEITRKGAANAKSYEDLLVNIKNNEELLENALIKKGVEVEFIEKVEAIASDVGNEVEIEHVETDKKKKVVSANADQSAEAIEQRKQEELKEQSRIGLVVTAKGNYKNFLEFLYKLENMPNVFEVDSVSVVKGSSRGRLVVDEGEAPDYTEGSVYISFIPIDL